MNNDDVYRRDLLFENMDSYEHIDIGSKCLCCDVCAKQCEYGSCDTKCFCFSINLCKIWLLFLPSLKAFTGLCRPDAVETNHSISQIDPKLAQQCPKLFPLLHLQSC